MVHKATAVADPFAASNVNLDWEVQAQGIMNLVCAVLCMIPANIVGCVFDLEFVCQSHHLVNVSKTQLCVYSMCHGKERAILVHISRNRFCN